jgi:hypothetical protein
MSQSSQGLWPAAAASQLFLKPVWGWVGKERDRTVALKKEQLICSRNRAPDKGISTSDHQKPEFRDFILLNL